MLQLYVWYTFIFCIIFSSCLSWKVNSVKFRLTKKDRSILTASIDDAGKVDHANNFSKLESLFFQRFALSVQKQFDGDNCADTYKDLIDKINEFSFSRTSEEVADRSKQMLVALFPPGLLPAYKFLFGPFEGFSSWMNTWVTWFTTQWLMGPSQVKDLELQCSATQDSIIHKQRLLQVEKCRFLESSGCVQTCINACKIPTQRFFYEEMGLPVTLKPNFTDYSCRFEFGVMPLPVEEDPSLRHPCLSACSNPCKGDCTRVYNGKTMLIK